MNADLGFDPRVFGVGASRSGGGPSTGAERVAPANERDAANGTGVSRFRNAAAFPGVAGQGGS